MTFMQNRKTIFSILTIKVKKFLGPSKKLALESINLAGSSTADLTIGLRTAWPLRFHREYFTTVQS